MRIYAPLLMAGNLVVAVPICSAQVVLGSLAQSAGDAAAPASEVPAFRAGPASRREASASKGDGAAREQRRPPKPRPKQPCSAFHPLTRFASARPETRPELEELVRDACLAVGRCDASAGFSELSGRSLAELGLWQEPAREHFRNTVQHHVEGHSSGHLAARRVAFAVAEGQTLAQLADSLEAGVKLHGERSR